MAIDNVPAVQSIIEQVGLLERAFKTPLDANLAYSRLADEEMFPNGIGETLTKTRPALFPLSAAMTPMNPSNNTGNDNGLTDQFYTFEQYQLAISEYALSTTVNIMQDATLIQKIFLQNYVSLGEHAGRTMDGLSAFNVHKAYDSGNTFANTAAISGATTVKVDNIVGFDTVFSNTNSPGLPVATSAGNPCVASVYDGSAGTLKGQITINTVTPDGTNASTGLVGNIAYGVSGTLNVTATTFAIAVGDAIVANDGSFVQRPGGVNNRSKLTSSSLITLSDIASAVAKLRARNVRPLPSGNYCCIIDPTLWPQLLKDQSFNYATMGQMGEGYFANGMVNRTLGVEFINSNLVPAFNIPSTQLKARHAVVGGQGLLVKGTFQGSLDAARQSNAMNNADIRLIEDAKISLITRGPLDRLQEQVTQTWRWVGGFVSPTDVTSTPAIIPTTDSARYKRAVIIEAASSV